MLNKRQIIINGMCATYYHTENFDPQDTLLFLHGWQSQASHFAKTLQKCPNAIAVDLPGFGESDTPSTAWSLDDYVDFVAHFIEKLQITNPIIAGHSFGGSIGIVYCARGNLVKKLILIGSAGIRKKNIKKYGFYIIAKIFKIPFALPGMRTLRNSVRKWFYKKIDSEDYLHAGVLTETYQKIITDDLTQRLQKITVPTVLIWGENDTETPLENGKLMERLIKNSQLHVIPHAGHYVFIDNSDAFDDLFLTAIV
ncbi:MAG: alpha/beta hydrolase [Parcubacteria group bacterium]|jgi:pimeloyl-ACP methyl ester carboxylesterase